MICELFIQYFIASGYIIKVAFCIPLTKKNIYIYIYIYIYIFELSSVCHSS